MKVIVREKNNIVQVVRKYKPKNGGGITLAEFSKTHGGYVAARLWVARKGHEEAQ